MIDPRNGEVKALVSAPSFDPALLNGHLRAESKRLEQDTQKPLYNRAIMGTYAPGSTFKPVQECVFLQEDCHQRSTNPFPATTDTPLWLDLDATSTSPVSLVPALATSCNAYFCQG